MNFAERASRIVTKAAADLEAELHAERGPDTRRLYDLVGQLHDAAGYLRQAITDLETGVET